MVWWWVVYTSCKPSAHGATCECWSDGSSQGGKLVSDRPTPRPTTWRLLRVGCDAEVSNGWTPACANHIAPDSELGVEPAGKEDSQFWVRPGATVAAPRGLNQIIEIPMNRFRKFCPVILGLLVGPEVLELLAESLSGLGNVEPAVLTEGQRGFVVGLGIGQHTPTSSKGTPCDPPKINLCRLDHCC